MKDWFFQTSRYFIITTLSTVICCYVIFPQHNIILWNLWIFFFFNQWRNLENIFKFSVQPLLKQFYYYFLSIFFSPVFLSYNLVLFNSYWLVTTLTVFLPFSVSVCPLLATFPKGTYLKNNQSSPALLKLVVSVKPFLLFLQTQRALTVVLD